MPERSSRRDFLRGKAPRAKPSEPRGEASWDPPERDRVEVSREAMACRFEVFLSAGQYAQGTEAALAALDEVDRVEGELSIFRDTSAVSLVNRAAAAGPVAVGPDLFALLAQAIQWHYQTDGALEITAGPLSDAWGFTRRRGRVPSETELVEAAARVGTRYLELDAEAGTIRFLRPGMQINLGAIGKGYALDRAAERLAEAGVEDYLIHGGQSSVLARGSLGAAHGAGSPSPGWIVGVPHPLRPRRRLARIRLRDRALGTSGSARQFFRHGGRRYSHVLDPRTGRPAEGLLSATVLAPNAAEADALATALFVLGPDRAVELVEAHAELAALLVVPRPANRVELLTVGFQDDELRLEGHGP